DQGMNFLWGFNHDEALKSFQRAAELDPKMAMAQWGIAYAVGPNYNLPVDEQRELQAYHAIQKALELSKGGPANERAYIEALARRYTNDLKGNLMPLAVDFSNAMRELVKRYPDDLDVATLFAESLMNLRPWKLWNPDGTPAPGTEECIATLESVLRRDPEHIGANHFYIHAVEASRSPERAMASAGRLADLAPGAGHLVHMPAHIYIRTGFQEASAETNKKAAAADEAFFRQSHQQAGIYPMMYYTHNLHFIAVSSAIMGKYDEAMAASKRIQEHVAPHLKQMPMLDGFNAVPLQIMVRFRRWDGILKLAQPDASLPVTTGMWHYARGMAFAAQGNDAKARAELEGLSKAAPEMAKIPTNSVGPENAGKMPKIAAHMIEARIAEQKKDYRAAAAHLREAVALEDSMDYTEPPDWIAPVRETLGAVLLQAGQAAESEKVFRQDLEQHPRNPRSLFGLMHALKAQGREEDAAAVSRQFKANWKSGEALEAGQL
ncbi:MAG TPA: hypothetical protein VMS96_12110, partial [Terriglobales bacterium]|nr:hypothetical protein [Terriglobales bacterium]